MKRHICLFVFLNIVCLIPAQSQPRLVYPDFHNGAVTGIDFSKNNKWLLTGGTDGRAMLFEAENRTLLRQFRGHYDAITGVSFAHLDTRIVTASFDGRLIIWEAKSGMQKRSWNAISGRVDSDKQWSRNPLFPAFCMDSAKSKMVFYTPYAETNRQSNKHGNKFRLCFYDFNKDSILWSMPVTDIDAEGRPFTLNHTGEWLLFTDYRRNTATGKKEPFIRLVYTADTVLQYRWWGNEATFDANEVVVCNGHNLLRFNPVYETAVVRNVNGGYGYNKQIAGQGYLLMQCMQQKEASNVSARNFNVKYPFQTIADSILYYLTGSYDMKLPHWRVADLKNQQTFTIKIQNDSGPVWQPVYRINESLSEQGVMAFSKANEKFAFIELNTGNTIVLNFFPGKTFPKAIIPFPNSRARWLISLEHEPSNKHEFALYELKLDFSKGSYSLSEFIESPILNQSLSVEDDNQVLPDVIIFPDGNRVLSADKTGGIRISDYSSGIYREKAAILTEKAVLLGPAAVNASGSLIRCIASSNVMYTFSSKTGQLKTAKKTDAWRLLPDQTLFNNSIVCYTADSAWKIEYSNGKALVTNQKTKSFTLINTNEGGMADFVVVNDRFLFGMGTDGGLRAYSLDSKQLLFTQYLFRNGGSLLITPDGRVDANEQVYKVIYGVQDYNTVNIDGLPDLSALGYTIVPGLRKQLLR